LRSLKKQKLSRKDAEPQRKALRVLCPASGTSLRALLIFFFGSGLSDLKIMFVLSLKQKRLKA
jgi:hypothetical protein